MQIHGFKMGNTGGNYLPTVVGRMDFSILRSFPLSLLDFTWQPRTFNVESTVMLISAVKEMMSFQWVDGCITNE